MAHAEDRLAGAILLGDNRAAGRVIRLFDRQEPVPSDRRTPLFLDLADRPTAEAAPETAVVGQCNGVSKETSLRHCTEPGTDLGRIARRPRATTDAEGAPTPYVPCSCRPAARHTPTGAGENHPASFQSCDYGTGMTNRA